MAGRQGGQRAQQEQRKRLRVDPDSWHYRLYRHWLTKYGSEFYGKERGVPSLKTLDLCRYMRALLLWIPLTYMVGVVEVARIWFFSRLLGRVNWPQWLRRAGPYIGIGLILLAGVTVSGVAVGMAVAQDPHRAAHAGLQMLWLIPVGVIGCALLVAILYAVSQQYRNFFKLVWAWIVAKKHKVCPLVEVGR